MTEPIWATPAIALATAVGLMTAVWIVSVFRRDVSIVDVFWGPGFVVLGWVFFALATPGSLWTIYSPLLMTFLLMRVSGVALIEKTLAKTKPGYEAYVARTNAFFPWFPRA